MQRNSLGLLLLVVSMVVATAAPAMAKMPPYDAEVSVDEDVATVTVVFDGYDMGVPTLEGIFALVPQDQPSDSASFIWIDLGRTEAFTYQGTVVIPYPGAWVITAFPDASPPLPAEMYPATTFTASFAQATNGSQTVGSTLTLPSPLPVVDPVSATAATDRSQFIWMGTGVGAVLLAGAWALRRRSRSSPAL